MNFRLQAHVKSSWQEQFISQSYVENMLLKMESHISAIKDGFQALL